MSHYITVAADGANLATGAASASVALPVDAAGKSPRLVRVAVTQPAYVKVGHGAQTATANDLLINPNNAVILAVRGCDTLAALAVSTAGVCQVSPVES